MKNVQLVRLAPTVEACLTSDPAFIEAMTTEDWPLLAATVHRIVGRKLKAGPGSVDTLAWGGYTVVDAENTDVVGSCAFTGPPNDDGAVEIAYFTFPDFEGKGYATRVANKLIELAAGSAEVRCVIAHTLPHANASTRVLEKCGLTFAGEVVDPDDGTIWRWQKQLTK